MLSNPDAIDDIDSLDGGAKADDEDDSTTTDKNNLTSGESEDIEKGKAIDILGFDLYYFYFFCHFVVADCQNYMNVLEHKKKCHFCTFTVLVLSSVTATIF